MKEKDPNNCKYYAYSFRQKSKSTLIVILNSAKDEKSNKDTIFACTTIAISNRICVILEQSSHAYPIMLDI